MAGRGYSIFDSTVGRCGIAWGGSGILGVQLPEAREIETRRRMLRQKPCDFSDVVLDMNGMPPLSRRVYEYARTIPRGETVTFAELAKRLGASGAAHAVGQAIGRNPFTILVPCHRVLAADGATDSFGMNGGMITKRRLLSLEGALAKSGPTLFDALLSVAPPRPQG